MNSLFLVAIIALYAKYIRPIEDTRNPNIGFFILPRRNHVENNMPKVMTLQEDGNWYFSEPSNTEYQIFIVKTPYGNKLCLKSNRNLCLRTEKAIYDKDITRYRKRKCKRAITRNRIKMVPSPYKNFFLIQMQKCLIYCLYSHEPNNKNSRAETSPNISKCNHSNINNHFYLLNEYDMDLHIPNIGKQGMGRGIEKSIDEQFPSILSKNPEANIKDMFSDSLESMF